MIAANSLTLNAGGRIESFSVSKGQAGDLTVIVRGNVNISGRSQDGLNSGLFSYTRGDGDGGALVISANSLRMEGSQIEAGTNGMGNAANTLIKVENLALTAGAQIDTRSLNSSGGNGGSIKINASGEIQVSGSDFLGRPSAILASTTGSGKGGNLMLIADELNIDDGIIASNSDSSGSAGDVTAIIRGALTMDGGVLQSNTLGGADAGNVTIRAHDLTISNGAQIASGIGSVGSDDTIEGFVNGRGTGGTLDITVTDTLSIAGGGLFTESLIGLGAAGNVSISTANLNISNTGQINADSNSEGRAGDVTVTATADILLRDALISANPRGSGKGGNVTVTTDRALVMMDEAIIQSNTFGDADAGKVTVKAHDLTLSSGAQISSGIGDAEPNEPIEGSPAGIGNGGSLNVVVTDTLLISSQSVAVVPTGLFTSAQIGQGNAGDISVTAGSLIIGGRGDQAVIQTASFEGSTGEAGDITLRVADLAQLINGEITARAVNTSGGNIRIRAGSLQLTGDSEVTSSVFGDLDTAGGNVTIEGGSLVLLDGSEVTAKADQGQGGNIQIFSDVFLYDGSVDEVLNASSGTSGNDGTVEVNSPENDIAGSITKLPASFLNAAALLSRRCAARDADETSSFVIVGRGGVPHGPDDWALSSYGSTGTAGGAQDADAGSDKDMIADNANLSGKAPFEMLTVNCAR